MHADSETHNINYYWGGGGFEEALSLAYMCMVLNFSISTAIFSGMGTGLPLNMAEKANNNENTHRMRAERQR